MVPLKSRFFGKFKEERCEVKEEEMKVKPVLIGLLTACLVFAGLCAVSYGAKAGPPTGFFGFTADFGKTSGFDTNAKADIALKSEVVKVKVKSEFYDESLPRDVAPLSLMIAPDMSELVQNYPNPFNDSDILARSSVKSDFQFFNHGSASDEPLVVAENRMLK